MNNLILFLNWILNWMVFYRYSMFEWIIKIYRPWLARGHQGAPEGSRVPPAPKRVIKQQNNGPKPWFKVPKVCPDPKGMVFTHFWGIWGHLDALKQPYLVKKPICQKPGFRKKIIHSFPQTTRCNFLMVSQFSIPPKVPTRYGKLPKNLIL